MTMEQMADCKWDVKKVHFLIVYESREKWYIEVM